MTTHNHRWLGIVSVWTSEQSDWVRLGRRLWIPSQSRRTIFSSVCLSSYDITSKSVKHAIIFLQTAEHHRCCLLQRYLPASASLRFIHRPVRFGSTLCLSLPDRPNYGSPSQAKDFNYARSKAHMPSDCMFTLLETSGASCLSWNHSGLHIQDLLFLFLFHLTNSSRSVDKITASQNTALLGEPLRIFPAQHEQDSFQKPVDW